VQEANVSDKFIEVKFSLPRDRFSVVLAGVKAIEGRFYNGASKTWFIPDSNPNRISLQALGFTIPVKEKAVYVEPQKEYDETLLSELPHPLRDYQKTSVRFAEASNWNCIIALAPRLGKTIVSLVGTILHKEMLPVLIVCPSGVKLSWRDAVREWLHDEPVVLSGRTPYRYHKTNYVIINFDVLYDWEEYLSTLGFQYLIVDESHRVGNVEIYHKDKDAKKGRKIPVKVTQAFLQLATDIPYRVLLSGTPATSAIAQLQPQLSIYIKKCAQRYWFLNHFCAPRVGYGGHRVYDGFSNCDEFRALTAPYMFRRTKQDVFKELPKEMHEFIPMEIDNVLYEQELALLKSAIKKEHLTEDQIDERLSKFTSLSYTVKRGQILQWIKDFLEVNDKLVVYCWHKVVAEDLLKAFKKQAVMVNGSVSTANKYKNIEAFNTNKKVKLFIGQIAAVKEGISLSAADTTFFVEFGTANAGAVKQASERTWLPELKQEKLCYYYAVGDGSVEEERIKVLSKRMKMLDGAFSGDSSSDGMFGEKLSDIL